MARRKKAPKRAKPKVPKRPKGTTGTPQSAKTGKFVTVRHALRNPGTTFFRRKKKRK